jgi:hypothetical protein
LKKKKKSSSSDKKKKKCGLSFEINGNLDISNPQIDKIIFLGERNDSVLAANKNKSRILPSTDKSTIKILSIPHKNEPSI